jgi:hypothetical protein
MATDISEQPGIEKAWSEWTKSGKQDVHAALEKDDPYAATSVDENMTDADIGPGTFTRVEIVQLMRTTLADIQDYIAPSEIGPQSASDVGSDTTPSLPQTTPPAIFASLKEIARSHNLCRKQYYVFLLLGASLLHYLLITMYGQEAVDAACEPPEPTNADDDGSKDDLRSIMHVIKHLLGTEPGSNKIRQLVMFFGGEAGTGKTEVTKAVTTLAKLWRVSHVLRKTATTGAAASLIGGSTIHILASLMQQLDKEEEEDDPRVGGQWRIATLSRRGKRSPAAGQSQFCCRSNHCTLAHRRGVHVPAQPERLPHLDFAETAQQANTSLRRRPSGIPRGLIPVTTGEGRTGISTQR